MAALLILAALFFAACSFDYGEDGMRDPDQPDVVMINVEYVRVREGDLVARFNAQRAERFEEAQVMEILYFSFEQFGRDETEINARGFAGAASVETDTSNIRMRGGVALEVDSEDFIIESSGLQWLDGERVFMAGPGEEVVLRRSNGTEFSGFGFRANARTREWEFSGGAAGIFIHDEDEDEGAGEFGLETGL